MNAIWEQYAGEFESGQKQDAVKAARLRVQQAKESDWQWLAQSLRDERRKLFIAAVFRNYPIPKRLFESFLTAAIHETNPSFNRQFVEPCVESFGHRRVNEFLLDVVEGDNNDEIAGAVAALYWANMQIQFVGDVPKYTLEHATEESRSAVLQLKDVWQRKRRTYLRVFVANEDVTVRRQILPSLKLDKAAYPDDLKPFVQQAIEIARGHSDDYIRHRVEVQLGNERLIKPLPDRQIDESENK